MQLQKYRSMKTKPFKYLFLVSLLLFQTNAHAVFLGESLGLSPFWNWKTIETKNFNIIFPEELEAVSKQSAIYFEEAHLLLSKTFRWQPRNKTSVVIIDNTDLANGLTSAALRIGMVLMVTPPDPSFSTAYYDDWLRLLILHEYTHFLNLDPTTDWANVLRVFFGDGVRLNSLWTRWMLEGLAVYMETRFTQSGRGRSPYYEMILRTAQKEQKLSNEKMISIDRIQGPNPFPPGGETPYLFGYQLMNQVAKDPNLVETLTDDQREKIKDGKDAIGVMSIRSSSRIPFFINDNLTNITGKDWYAYWKEWKKEAVNRTNEELKKIRSQPVSITVPLTSNYYSIYATAVSPLNNEIAFNADPENDTDGLFLLNTKTKKISKALTLSIPGGISYSPNGKWIATSGVNRFHHYNFFSDLVVYNTDAKTVFDLSTGLRAKDPDFSKTGNKLVYSITENQSLSIQIADFVSRNDQPYLANKKTIYQSEFLDRASMPRWVLNDTAIVFTLHKNKTLGTSLVLLDLKTGTLTTLLDHNEGFIKYVSTSLDKNTVFFTADFSGVDNLYQLALNHSRFGPQLVSNTETGLWHPSTLDKDDSPIWASEFSTDGWKIVQMDKKNALSYKSVEINSLPAPASETSPSELQEEAEKNAQSKIKNYSALPSLLPRQWSPLLTVDPNRVYWGGVVFGFDDTHQHQYFGIAAYDHLVKEADGLLQYSNRQLGPTISLTGDIHTSSYSSISGELISYIRKKRLDGEIYFPLLWNESTLGITIAGRIEREFLQIPSQSKAVSYGEILPSADLAFSFQNLKSYRLSIVPEKGRKTKLSTRYYFESSKPTVKFLASNAENIALGNHFVLSPSLAGSWTTRTSQFNAGRVNVTGRSQGTLSALNANQARTLDELKMRGYPNTVIYAGAAAIGAMDFQYPIGRLFSGLGTNPLFFKNLYGVSFAESTLFPKTSSRGSISLPSIGSAIRLDVDVFLNIPLTLSLEYHHGFKKNFGGTGETFFLIGAPQITF